MDLRFISMGTHKSGTPIADLDHIADHEIRQLFHVWAYTQFDDVRQSSRPATSLFDRYMQIAVLHGQYEWT